MRVMMSEVWRHALWNSCLNLSDSLPSFESLLYRNGYLSDRANWIMFREPIDLSLHLRIASKLASCKTSHGKRRRLFVEMFDLIIIYNYTSLVDCLSILYLRPFNERCGNLL